MTFVGGCNTFSEAQRLCCNSHPGETAKLWEPWSSDEFEKIWKKLNNVRKNT